MQETRCENLDALAEFGARDRRRARPALDLHGQRRAAALDRGDRRRARRCRSTSTSPRPSRRSTTASREHGVRPAAYLDRLGLLGERTVLAHGVWLDRGRAGADRRARLHGRHQPGRQHEARRRRRLPLPGRAARPGSRSGSAPTGRLQRLARPARRPQGRSRSPSATPPATRPCSPAEEAWRIATGASALRCSAAGRLEVGEAGRLPAAAPRLARARRSAICTPTSSTRPAARSSTRPSSPGGC